MTQEWIIPLQITVSIGSPDRVPEGDSPKRVQARAALGVRAATASKGVTESSDPFMDKFSIPSLNRTDFDWHTALSLALASRLAYGSAGEVEVTTRQTWGLETCEFVEADDTQCFVATSADAVLVSFRGTENLGDWLSNLNLLTTSRPYGKVHRGFLGAFQVVEQKLLDILARFPGRRVLLTGHSLGGALALVAAAEWRNKFQIAWVHTHGQPGTGKKDFQGFIQGHYADNYYRFVNDDDIVPMVPPAFKHAGRLIHFTAEGDLERVAGSSVVESLGIEVGAVPVETPMLSEEEFDLLRARLLQERVARAGAPLTEASVERATVEAVGATATESLEGLFPSVSDHSIDLYVAKIGRKAGF